MPVRGLGGRVISLASRALAPRSVRGLVDVGTLAGLGCGLRTATGLVEFARTLRVTVRDLDKCAGVHLAFARPPGRLAGPCLLRGCGHKGRSGSALALSLPWIVINKKSDLVPSKPALYLSVTIDSGAARIFLPLRG